MSLIMVVVLSVSAFASEITVVVNGTTLSFDQPPINESGRTLVPVRAITEALGAEVEWEQSTKTVTATKDDIIVTIQIDNDTLYKNSEEITLDVPAMLVGERTLIPVRAIAESFGAEVGWEESTQTVTIDLVAIQPPAEVAIPKTELTGSNIHGKLTLVTHGKNTAYVFGSMHVGLPAWYPLHPMVEEAMARSDVFAFEIADVDSSDISDEFAEHAIASMTLPDGLTLKDVLPKDIFDNFSKNIKTYAAIGLEYEQVAHMTPNGLVFTLPFLIAEYLDADADISVDSYVSTYAKTQGKPVIGLTDELDEISRVFDMPMETQVFALVDFPDFDTMLVDYSDTNLIDSYTNQDLEALLAAISAGIQNDDPYSQHISNMHWNVRCHIFADEIARLLKETKEPTTFFITIGIGHILGGDAGQVLNLLEGMDFELTELWKETLE